MRASPQGRAVAEAGRAMHPGRMKCKIAGPVNRPRILGAYPCLRWPHVFTRFPTPASTEIPGAMAAGLSRVLPSPGFYRLRRGGEAQSLTLPAKPEHSLTKNTAEISMGWRCELRCLAVGVGGRRRR